jgi:hypothetical protein
MDHAFKIPYFIAERVGRGRRDKYYMRRVEADWRGNEFNNKHNRSVLSDQ